MFSNQPLNLEEELLENSQHIPREQYAEENIPQRWREKMKKELGEMRYTAMIKRILKTANAKTKYNKMKQVAMTEARMTRMFDVIEQALKNAQNFDNKTFYPALKQAVRGHKDELTNLIGQIAHTGHKNEKVSDELRQQIIDYGLSNKWIDNLTNAYNVNDYDKIVKLVLEAFDQTTKQQGQNENLQEQFEREQKTNIALENTNKALHNDLNDLENDLDTLQNEKVNMQKLIEYLKQHPPRRKLTLTIDDTFQTINSNQNVFNKMIEAQKENKLLKTQIQKLNASANEQSQLMEQITNLNAERAQANIDGKNEWLNYSIAFLSNKSQTPPLQSNANKSNDKISKTPPFKPKSFKFSPTDASPLSRKKFRKIQRQIEKTKSDSHDKVDTNLHNIDELNEDSDAKLSEIVTGLNEMFPNESKPLLESSIGKKETVQRQHTGQNLPPGMTFADNKPNVKITEFNDEAIQEHLQIKESKADPLLSEYVNNTRIPFSDNVYAAMLLSAITSSTDQTKLIDTLILNASAEQLGIVSIFATSSGFLPNNTPNTTKFIEAYRKKINQVRENMNDIYANVRKNIDELKKYPHSLTDTQQKKYISVLLMYLYLDNFFLLFYGLKFVDTNYLYHIDSSNDFDFLIHNQLIS